ncbi:hypothetical protein OCU04_002318 [Sclerotinia nivalis]|uniref:Mid2 domain-containing protein n=1 Tax=Sclerotinia nivalis TaxID=352851 RepID=A0A9X0DM24_9HELO|nr:hypothetical protein OCU04_002318 [Sclerotinia nivalis]
MRVLQNVSLHLILPVFASLVHSFQFTNTAFNPVLGQKFTITWIDSTGSVILRLVPTQYYNDSIPLASAVSIGVATTGNSLPWTPNHSLHTGVYKIYWVPSGNTQSQVDSPTFTLGQVSSSSSTSTSSAHKSQASSNSSSKPSSTTGTSNPTTRIGGAASSSSSTMNTPSETNQTNSLTNTIKISIAISIILGLTLIMVIAFMLIRRRRYLASIPRTKRQLTTREIAHDNDSWYGEHQFKPELSIESEAATSSYVELVKKKHVSINMEPVEMEAYFVRKNVNDRYEIDDRGNMKDMRETGFGLGLGNVEELVEPRELDAGTTLGKGKIGRRFNVRDNVHIIGL